MIKKMTSSCSSGYLPYLFKENTFLTCMHAITFKKDLSARHHNSMTYTPAVTLLVKNAISFSLKSYASEIFFLPPQPQFIWMLTCAGVKDGNIGKLIQFIELNVSLSLFTIMIYLQWNTKEGFYVLYSKTFINSFPISRILYRVMGIESQAQLTLSERQDWLPVNPRVDK